MHMHMHSRSAHRPGEGGGGGGGGGRKTNFIIMRKLNNKKIKKRGIKAYLKLFSKSKQVLKYFCIYENTLLSVLF